MKKIQLSFLLVLLLFCSCEQDLPEIQGTQTLKIEGIEYPMVLIVTPEFTMGATAEQGSYAIASQETPTHNVQLSSYYIGEQEVTQGLWRAVMGDDSLLTAERQVLGLGDNLPVHNITWQQAVAFCKAVSRLTGNIFCLPSEAEWECAARAGVQDNIYAGSSILENVGWNGYEYVNKIKLKGSNNYGLYDMSGNVAEFCSDWYGPYTGGNQIEPQGPETGTYKVVRGGSATSAETECRVSARRRVLPTDTIPDCGIRLVLKY